MSFIVWKKHQREEMKKRRINKITAIFIFIPRYMRRCFLEDWTDHDTQLLEVFASEERSNSGLKQAYVHESQSTSNWRGLRIFLRYACEHKLFKTFNYSFMKFPSARSNVRKNNKKSLWYIFVSYCLFVKSHWKLYNLSGSKLKLASLIFSFSKAVLRNFVERIEFEKKN